MTAGMIKQKEAKQGHLNKCSSHDLSFEVTANVSHSYDETLGLQLLTF